jgi:TatD DNase family protein
VSVEPVGPAAGPRWIDNHCHLDPERAAEQVEAARAAGVVGFVNVGTDRAGSTAAIAVAERFDDVWATAGVHPHDASGGIDGIAELLAHPKVVAVGEAGLDYHYDHSPRALQRDVFARQVALAHAHDLPLVVHSRSAWDDTFAVLDQEGVPARTLFHCFTGGPGEAAECLARGAYLSISGIVTFKSADDVRAAVDLAPIDRLLVETDSPYLAPVPHRGRPNTPAWVGVVGEAVALRKGVDAAVFATQTRTTTMSFYGLSVS